MPARTDIVILRPWRDGSVHAEIPTASFHGEDDVLLTHVDDSESRSRFTTLCGQPYWGVASAWSYRHPQTVDCEECRKLLLGEEG